MYQELDEQDLASLCLKGDRQAQEELYRRYAARLFTLCCRYSDNQDEDRHFRLHINPEAGLLGRLNLARWLALEGTADWAVQYYHTLEGIPMGWSLDLLVPADSEHGPEQTMQYYGAALTEFGQHRVTVGAYWKKMYNLVWFVDAGQLFSPAISGWKDNISVGTGSS